MGPEWTDVWKATLHQLNNDRPLPAPHGVVLSIGGNGLVAKGTSEMLPNSGRVASETADGALAARWPCRRYSRCLIIILSVIPRCQLSDGDLAAFRNLSAALNNIAADLAPRVVFLDAERLLNADRSASGSRRRQHSFHLHSGTGGAVAAGSDAPVSPWSGGTLPQDFPRLGPYDFEADGVHLHPLSYRTIPCSCGGDSDGSHAASKSPPPTPDP